MPAELGLRERRVVRRSSVGRIECHSLWRQHGFPVDQNLRPAACPHNNLLVLTESSITVEPAWITPYEQNLFAAALWRLPNLCKSYEVLLHLSIASAMTHGHAQQQRSTEKVSTYSSWLGDIEQKAFKATHQPAAPLYAANRQLVP